jgi:glycosyltransferase involved in cell wall biosynthesis
MPDIDVSVVVCTYNRAPSLRVTLAALDAQVVPAALRWELIVVDNGSTDDTARVVQAFAASARIPVRYWREQQPGLSRARNAALPLAQGRVLAFTDDDVRPAPGWVAAVDAVTRETGADVLGGQILPEWEAPPPAWLSRRPRLWSYLTVLDHDAPAVLAGAHGVPTVWGANMAARREVLADLRGFDPRRGVIGTTLHGGEDLDMVTRALAAGYRAVYDPRVVVAHRVGPERMRRRYLSRLCYERAEGHALVDPPPAGRLLLGAPPFAYRTALVRLGRWLAAAARRRPDTLERWLECCKAAGTLRGLWKRGRTTRAERTPLSSPPRPPPASNP